MSEPAQDKPKDAARAAAKEPSPEAPKGAAKEVAPKQPAKASPPLVLIGVSVGALVAGAALGALVVAPRFTAGRVAPPPAAHAEAAEAEHEEPAEEAGHGKSGDSHGKSEGKKNHLVRLENLIVNPAGSGGTRFLMATVAFEVPDEKVEARLRDNEVRVRDQVMATLESHTLEMLTAPGSRDSLKLRLARAIAPVAGKGQRVRVYLPQFVLQ